MKQVANNISALIATAVMLVVGLGVLTAEEGDMLMRAVATASTAVVGAALILVEAWKRQNRGEEGVTEISVEGVSFEVAADGLQALGKAAYEAYADDRSWKRHDGRPMPVWDVMGAELQASWLVAAEAILGELEQAEVE